MVGEGYWTWARGGRYRGIPLSNFLGWLAAGAAVMAALEAVLPIGSGDDADRALVAQYGFVAAMETVGFAAFFRDRLVATRRRRRHVAHRRRGGGTGARARSWLRPSSSAVGSVGSLRRSALPRAGSRRRRPGAQRAPRRQARCAGPRRLHVRARPVAVDVAAPHRRVLRGRRRPPRRGGRARPTRPPVPLPLDRRQHRRRPRRARCDRGRTRAVVPRERRRVAPLRRPRRGASGRSASGRSSPAR